MEEFEKLLNIVETHSIDKIILATFMIVILTQRDKVINLVTKALLWVVNYAGKKWDNKDTKAKRILITDIDLELHCFFQQMAYYVEGEIGHIIDRQFDYPNEEHPFYKDVECTKKYLKIQFKVYYDVFRIFIANNGFNNMSNQKLDHDVIKVFDAAKIEVYREAVKQGVNKKIIVLITKIQSNIIELTRDNLRTDIIEDYYPNNKFKMAVLLKSLFFMFQWTIREGIDEIKQQITNT